MYMEDEKQKNVHPYESVLDENASIYQKQEPKTEKQKWKELKGKEKVQYFLQYYGLLSLGILIGIGVLISLTVHFVTQKDVALGILAVNADGTEIKATGQSYFKDFLEENGVNVKKHTVSVNYTAFIDADSEDSVDQANLDTIQTLFMTRSVDVFFSDPDFFEVMASQDYISDIRDYLPDELLEKYSDEIFWVDNTQTGEKIAAGISLNDNVWLTQTGWYSDDTKAVVGVPDGVSHEDLAVAMLLDILQEK